MKFDRVFAVIIATIIFGVNICHAQFHLPKSGGSFTLNFIGTMPRGDFAKASQHQQLLQYTVLTTAEMQHLAEVSASRLDTSSLSEWDLSLT